ncbi:SDR family NAD(P)-dependent oxidoreductase [Aquisalimonas asiatica]|uniref:NAD(P)-dependent dehydrogenase, short-chain alcohol dehydrogenase family n=1 Tax=Aquisalimonas asiatica TaxID=406100 RepID=A0A1H8RVW7_9GAMM|nr:SDR family oxidoreductase [Aquisalimonas asiatica]SEO70447.1 NAD(P)-dependent dehydrogenase, short-chain alcohol dehydrogenase family [Aquisalimonas asiatica]
MAAGIRDRAAIITGAGSGIGRATALRFATEGARLMIADVNEEALAETVRQVETAGGTVISRCVNVADEQAVADMVAATAEQYGSVDILCNNAGITGGTYGPITDDDADTWRRVLDVNLLGAMFGSKYAGRIMAEQQRGAIVNTASVAGIRAGAGGNAYSASKAAVINMTQTSACDLGQYGVRVNAVCPGLTETGMTKPVFDYARDRGKEDKLGARCELRRYGRPEELAAAILFLASDEASFITGQALAVDGGNTASLNMPGMKV